MTTDPSTASALTASAATEPTSTGADAVAGTIAAARDRIDALDRQIIGLVQERMATSAEIQAARISAGGTRVALNREMEILARYRSALGPQGTEVAMQLLALCRGRA
jgi:chorismate mutase